MSLGLPRFLLPGGFHFIACFWSLPSSILWTCPYHFSCLVLISSKRDLVIFIFCLIIVFLILSFLESRAERRQKSISVEFSFANTFVFKHHVSAALCEITGSNLCTEHCACFLHVKHQNARHVPHTPAYTQSCDLELLRSACCDTFSHSGRICNSAQFLQP